MARIHGTNSHGEPVKPGGRICPSSTPTSGSQPCYYATTSSNLGGTPRTGYLLYHGINTSGEQVTERWTVIQDATLDESRLAADADITLLVKPERELRLSGDTVYIDYGTFDANEYKNYLNLRDNPAAQKKLEHTLNIMGYTITAKGSGNRPMYATTATDWIRVANTTADDGHRPDHHPSAGIPARRHRKRRQFRHHPPDRNPLRFRHPTPP